MILTLASLCSLVLAQPALRAPVGLSARYRVDAAITVASAGGSARTLTQNAVVSLVESKPDDDGTSTLTGAFESLTAELAEGASQPIAFRFAPADPAPADESDFARDLRAAAAAGFSLIRFGGQLLPPPAQALSLRPRMPAPPEPARHLGPLAPSALPATFAPVVGLDPAARPRRVGESWTIERSLTNGITLRLTPAVESIEGQRVAVRGPVEITSRPPEPGSAEPAILVTLRAGEFRAVWVGDRLESSDLRYDATWTARAATDPPVERSTTTSTRITLTLVRDP
ncbi:MAG: hypothetical protein JNM80_14720 [Phycisphaerae bacterium]|nr:hypothetical protein [Phycisphaerae bacterium]